MPRVRCMLVLPDGLSRRVAGSPVLIGRQHDCDVVGSDQAMSRRHALVRVTSDGAELVPLSRGAIAVSGKPCDQPRLLVDGDTLEFPGLVLRVRIEPEEATAAGLVLERANGSRLGIAQSPFRIGGGGEDELVIAGWAPAAIVLHGHGDRVHVDAIEGVQINDAASEPGVTIGPGDRIAYRGEQFTIVSADRGDVSTVAAPAESLPREVTVELLPRGGLLVCKLGGASYSVFLADKRFDLLMALLAPPGDHKAGDVIADDVLRAVVWPRNDGVGRTEINVLISRCRRDLVEAGLDGARLIQRAPGGGGTRFVLARDASVEIKR